MVMIQIDLDREEDRIVELVNARNGFKDKRLALKHIIKSYEKLCKP